MKGEEPHITSDGAVTLKQARHPLIEYKKAVPIDVSVGDGYTINGTTAGAEGASENFVSLNAAGCDVLDMNITVNYTDKYSFYFLVKAMRTDDAVTENSFNGFLFMFTQDGVKIGAEVNGTLRWVTSEQMVFENGKETSVRISAVPCDFRGDFYGYHLSVQMGIPCMSSTAKSMPAMYCRSQRKTWEKNFLLQSEQSRMNLFRRRT